MYWIFFVILVSLRRSIFYCLPQREKFSDSTPSPNTESNQPLFLVSFEPVLWLLTRSLQFSTTSSSMSTLTKNVLKWPCLEQKGGLHILVNILANKTGVVP